MESKRQRRLRLTAKWAAYSLMLLVAATLQTIPGLFTIGGAKPIFILPLCLAVALFEGEYAGALFGAVCGLLWDYTAGRTVGLLALGLLVLGFVASIIVRMYLQETSANFLLLVAGSALLLLSTDFLFFYAMRGYPNGLQQYCTVVLPTLIFTAALSPLAFVGARAVHVRWGES